MADDWPFTVNRQHLDVVSLRDPSSDLEYWRSKSPQERLQAVELMRQVIYGYDPASARLSRVLAVAERA